MRFFGFNKRIGVVGMYRSGKTVFMTSLLNHLERHDPDRFPLGKKRIRLGNFRPLPIEGGFREFNYERHRHSLVSLQRWPTKTRMARQFRFSLTRSDWRYTLLDLTLTDLPGERLADIRIAQSNYEAWSDEILRLFSTEPEYFVQAKDYLKTLARASGQDSDPNADEILHAYRLALARACLHYLPVITPSSFLLGPQGDYCGQRDENNMAQSRYVGLDKDNQFGPLSKDLRAKHPGLTNLFKKRYELYRSKVVAPTAHWLAQCNELVVLLDITTILAGGLGMYHGALALIEDLISYVDPGRGILGQLASGLLKPLSAGHLTLPGITRIAFVASKADKVHASDRQKLLSLLRSMVQSRMRDLSEDYKLRVEYFACAAVKSTVSLNNGKLEGQPVELLQSGSNDRPPVVRFAPSKVPGSWPDNWGSHEYRFPDILPQMPARKDLAPPHLGLNLVADFILSPDHLTE